MTDPTYPPSNAMTTKLRQHAQAWGVTADTPDIEVLNETAMARECARAADEIERLESSLETACAERDHLQQTVNGYSSNEPAVDDIRVRIVPCLREAHQCLQLAKNGDGFQIAAAIYKVEEAVRMISEPRRATKPRDIGAGIPPDGAPSMPTSPPPGAGELIAAAIAYANYQLRPRDYSEQMARLSRAVVAYERATATKEV